MIQDNGRNDVTLASGVKNCGEYALEKGAFAFAVAVPYAVSQCASLCDPSLKAPSFKLLIAKKDDIAFKLEPAFSELATTTTRSSSPTARSSSCRTSR